MRAMVLDQPRRPLRLATLPDPIAGRGQILLKVEACGVCRTDLHIADGELTRPKLPLVLGHEIVGRVLGCGEGVAGFSIGQRVGVPWLGATCGHCAYCDGGAENLCDEGRFTGYDIDGGYADMTVADARYCFPLDEDMPAAVQAPLLCAGLIGFRSYRLAGRPRTLGIYGFGAAAHLVAQLAIFEGVAVYAFTRAGDGAAQRFALDLGCAWAGSSEARAPVALDAALVFAPVGALVLKALAAVRKGGTVVCGGIHMSDIPQFGYDLLWGERIVRSVANLTREDGRDFFPRARRAGIVPRVETFPLENANDALDRLRRGDVNGAAVLVP